MQNTLNRLSNRYRYLLILTVFLIIVVLFYYSYQNTLTVIEKKHDALELLVERSILDRVKHVSVSYKITEKYIDREMENYALDIREKYRDDPDPLSWKLEGLRKLAKGYDIYIIDTNLKIIKTTDKSYLGFDYSKYSSYAELLQERLQNNTFISDSMDISSDTKVIKKYGFISSPDHSYLIELGIDVYQKFPELRRLNVISLAKDLIKKNQFVDNIMIYKFKDGGRTIGEISNMEAPILSTDLSDEKADLIRGVLKENRSTRYSKKSGVNNSIKYISCQVFDREGNLNWSTSYVIGLNFNKRVMNLEILRENRLFAAIILILSLVFITFIYIIVRLLKNAEYLAYHDKLTDLPNRKLFQESFKEITAGDKQSDFKLAFLFLDLDGFKKVNDTYGHDIGDELLKGVARRLNSIVRKDDVVSRLGGDEFTIMLANISSASEAQKVAEKIADNFKKPIIIKAKEFIINASIGISIYPEDGIDIETLLKKADRAMYVAKNNGTGSYIKN